VSAARLAGALLSTADIGIIVAGVVGPGLGYLAGWGSDIRRFRVERRLKASDDLRDRIDEVGATLEAFSVAAVGVRTETIQHATSRAPELGEIIRVAEDTYEAARVSVARLEMRAHADDALTNAANEAVELLRKPAQTAGSALNARGTRSWRSSKSITGIAEIPQMVDEAFGGIKRYQIQAKRTDAALVGTPSRWQWQWRWRWR
jgi:hypothetical protein